MSWSLRARVLIPGVIVSAVTLLAGAGPVDAQSDNDAPTTTTTTAASASTTTAPATTTTTAPSAGSSEPLTTTSTTTAPDEPPEDRTEEELPPASAIPLPPEEEPPPPPPPIAVPPGPPAGADDAGRIRAQAELRAADTALRLAQAAERKLARGLLPHQERLAAAKARLESLSEADRRAADELALSRLRVRKMAVAGYVRGGDTQNVDYLLRAADPVDLERRRTLVEAATEARATLLHHHEVMRRAASAELVEAVKAVDAAQANFAGFDAEVTSAAAVAAMLAAEVENRRQLLEAATAASTVGSTDIPRLVLDAYRAAANRVARDSPHCRVGWTAIAGIGKVESNHGRYRGAQFALNGDVFPRILGIPLDGTRSALIRDTDGGVLDFDTEFDRAVGPMQFIPSTWARIDQDGNGDGIRDPNNIYDAALGTAKYLCRAVPSGGLDTDAGLRPAFFSYNHSTAYVEKVLGWTRLYGELAAAGV